MAICRRESTGEVSLNFSSHSATPLQQLLTPVKTRIRCYFRASPSSSPPSRPASPSSSPLHQFRDLQNQHPQIVAHFLNRREPHHHRKSVSPVISSLRFAAFAVPVPSGPLAFGVVVPAAVSRRRRGVTAAEQPLFTSEPPRNNSEQSRTTPRDKFFSKLCSFCIFA